jgi:hypothetical protein
MHERMGERRSGWKVLPRLALRNDRGGRNQDRGSTAPAVPRAAEPRAGFIIRPQPSLPSRIIAPFRTTRHAAWKVSVFDPDQCAVSNAGPRTLPLLFTHMIDGGTKWQPQWR